MCRKVLLVRLNLDFYDERTGAKANRPSVFVYQLTSGGESSIHLPQQLQTLPPRIPALFSIELSIDQTSQSLRIHILAQMVISGNNF